MLDEDRLERLAADAHALFGGSDVSRSDWSEADPYDRAANLDSARFVPTMLAALGLAVAPLGAQPHLLSPEQVEAGGRLEHLRWCRFTRRAGRPEHPDLVSWDELDEATRELDLERVRELPRLLAEQGLMLVERGGA